MYVYACGIHMCTCSVCPGIKSAYACGMHLHTCCLTFGVLVVNTLHYHSIIAKTKKLTSVE
jgi:hypothetical protein